jgi:4'-phosphopantetheinyl transferase
MSYWLIWLIPGTVASTAPPGRKMRCTVFTQVVTHGGNVGVDVERIPSESVDDAALAQQHFTRAEAALVQSTPAALRTEVFLRLWTRKEAFLKGLGDGLSESLSHFEVSLSGAEIRRTATGEPVCGSWLLHEFDPCPGYVAVVATKGFLPILEFHSLESKRS